MGRIIIHYHRDDANYDPWGIWLWPEGYGGRWVPFTASDYFGKIAMCQVEQEHKRFGFLIRGVSWEKDVDQDRYIADFIGDTAEVWLISGDPQVYPAPPAHLRERIRTFPELELTIHYHRHDGDYSGWNVWLWGENLPGTSLDFSGSDEYGALARITLQDQTDGEELGFLIRRSVLGQPWLAKDISKDRFVPLYRASDTGKLEVWLLQDDPKVYYRPEDVDRTPRIILASLEAVDTIRVECHLPVKPGPAKWAFQLFAEKEELDISEVHPIYHKGSPRSFILKTAFPLDLTKHYRLRHKTHGTKEVTFGQVYSSPEFYRAFHYSGQDLGANYSPEATTFKVWAPTAKRLEVVLYQDGEGGKGTRVPLQKGEKGVWETTVSGDLEGMFYNFLVSQGDKIEEVVDPYAKATGVNGKRGQIVDLAKTDPEGWESAAPPPLENPVDAVIYEVHVRDFSSSPGSGIENKGLFLGLTEEGTTTPSGLVTGLDHLKELGITHVHLLPIFDFATVNEKRPEQGYNWGYDPLNFNVPEGSYSSNPYDGRVRLKELKTTIQKLSEAGIGVVMDVVYNHTFHSLASSFQKLVPGYFYRQHPDGRFSNGSGCGNELADERSMVRKFIVDSVCYWAKEYKLAGFRFDLMGLHHLETMREIRKALDKVNPQILIYGEGWAAGPSTLPEYERAVKENTPRLPGIASFCNDLRDGVKGHVFHTHEGGFIQGQGLEETLKFGLVGAVQHPQIDYSKVLYSKGPWALHPSQSVAYVEAHDNLTLWDKLLCTTADRPDEDRVRMMKLATAIVLLSQGVPFLHAGQEYARTKGGDPNSYQSPDHINQLDWERKGEFRKLCEYTQKLIALRKSRPAFRLRTGEEVRQKLQFLEMPEPNLVGFALGPNAGGDSYETILVFLNGNPYSVEVELDSGNWEMLVNDLDVGRLGKVGGPKVLIPGISCLVLAREGES